MIDARDAIEVCAEAEAVEWKDLCLQLAGIS
jgi:hypothetical protein